MQKSSDLSRPYFENLNGLRALGALAVFLFHAFTLGNETWGEFYDNKWFQAVVKICSKGHYGVSLFFVLSGFLITYLLLHEAKTRGKIHVFGFFMRRLLRIWPVYFIVVGFGFLVYPHLPFGIQTTNSPVYYAFFLSNIEEIRNGYRDAVNLLTITWSVSIEEQFYLAWVVLLALFPFLQKGKGFLPYLLAIAILSLAFRFLYVTDYRVLYYHTFAVMSDLAIGGILAYFCFFYQWNTRYNNLHRGLIISIYAAGIALILGVRIVFSGNLIAIEKWVLGLFFAFVIFDQAFGKHSFFKADKLPMFFSIGTVSYGFYMYHCIVIYYVQIGFKSAHWNESILGFLGYLLLSFFLTFAISWASYRWIEKPILRLKERFSA